MTRRAGKGLAKPVKGSLSHPDAELSPEQKLELMREGRKLAAQKKADRTQKFEETMAEQLDAVAHLLSMTTSLASDPDVILSPAQMQKMQLGIKAAQVILDRSLGKAVTRVEGDIRHTIVDEMATTLDAWEADDAEIIEDE